MCQLVVVTMLTRYCIPVDQHCFTGGSIPALVHRGLAPASAPPPTPPSPPLSFIPQALKQIISTKLSIPLHDMHLSKNPALLTSKTPQVKACGVQGRLNRCDAGQGTVICQ